MPGSGAARVSVTFRSEAARIDLNAAPKGLLAGLMVGLGANPSNAAGYADRILAWRAPTEAGEDDPENSSYRTSGVAYVPRHAPFPAAEELWLVRGIPPPVIERMLPFVTVFSNMASINVLDAAPQVVAALPGMTPETLAGGAVAARRSAARPAIADRRWPAARERRLAAPRPTGSRSMSNCRSGRRSAARGRDPASRRAATSLIVYCRGVTPPTAARHRKGPL